MISCSCRSCLTLVDSWLTEDEDPEIWDRCRAMESLLAAGPAVPEAIGITVVFRNSWTRGWHRYVPPTYFR